MNLLKNITSNTVSQIISRAISSGAGFVIALLVARSFGINGYSDLAKITALVGLFYLFIDLGANAIFLQLEEHVQQFSAFLSFRLLLALGVFVLVSLVAFLLPYNTKTAIGYSPLVKLGIIFFSLSFFSRAIVFSTAAIFQQQFSYHFVAKATIISTAVLVAFVVSAYVWHLPILWIIAAYVVSGFTEAGYSLFAARQKFFLPLPSLMFVKQLFFQTLPITILLFLNLLYFRIDMVLLALLQKSSAVGVYDYAYKYFDFLIALPLFLSNSVYPLLLRQEKFSRINRKNISLYTALFFMLGLLLIPVVWFFAPLIGLVKQEFAASIAPLRILSLSLPVFFATNILQWIFITKKKQKLLVGVYGVSLVLNILLNILFIPHFSYIAAAIITGACETFILLVMFVLVFVTKL